MKLLFFSPYFHPYVSGLTVYPLRVLTHLAHKHQITVLTYANKQALPAKESYQGLTIIRLPAWFKVSKGFISPPAFFNSSRYLSGCDGLIINLPSAEGVWLTRQAHTLKLPILAIYHCHVTLGPSLTERFITWNLAQAVNYQLRLASRVVVNSLDYARSLPNYNLIKVKVAAIYPPVDPKFYTRAQAIAHQPFNPPKPPVIGVVGRLAREKGILELIQALTILKGIKPRLAFVGPSPTQVAGERPYYDQVITALKRAGLPYQMHGQVSLSQLASLYSQFSLLAYPSNSPTESFGLVQIEAMLAGTPVVASNLPGVRLPVQLTGMGLTVPPRDPLALSIAIRQVISHRPAYTQPAQIKQVSTLFDPHQSFALYDQLITQTFAS